MKPQRFKLVIDGRALTEAAIRDLSAMLGALVQKLPGWEPCCPPVTYYMLPEDAPLGAQMPLRSRAEIHEAMASAIRHAVHPNLTERQAWTAMDRALVAISGDYDIVPRAAAIGRQG